jgi:hypothetical protein
MFIPGRSDLLHEENPQGLTVGWLSPHAPYSLLALCAPKLFKLIRADDFAWQG